MTFSKTCFLNHVIDAPSAPSFRAIFTHLLPRFYAQMNSLSQGLSYQVKIRLEGGRKWRGASIEVDSSEKNSAGLSVPIEKNSAGLSVPPRKVAGISVLLWKKMQVNLNPTV